MRVGVFGAGAVGCYLGGRLASECDVVLVARNRIAREIAPHGLTTIDLDGDSQTTRRAEVDTNVTRLASSDVVLVTVKSAQTEEAAIALRPKLSPTELWDALVSA
jgi:2-dehydropantoate 2-reductase